MIVWAAFGPTAAPQAASPSLRPKTVPRITLANLSPPFTEYAYFQQHEAVPFESAAETFSPVNAWWLAEISTLVYADGAYSEQRLRKAGYQHIVFFDRAGTYAVAAANDRFAVVAFRGSEIWKRSERFDPRQVLSDFRTNIDIRLADWEGGGRVHQGFKTALDAVWEEMAPEIERLQDRGLKIWITGHSLGAALATLAADRLPEIQGLYTFGSPRVGDKAFQDHFNRPAYRVVNGDDIVASVPGTIPFRHVGTLVVIDSRGRLHLDGNGPTTGSEGSDRGQATPGSPTFQKGLDIDTADFIPDAIRDHVPLLYAVKLWNVLVDSQATGAERETAAARPTSTRKGND
jgi:hypothetical protein